MLTACCILTCTSYTGILFILNPFEGVFTDIVPRSEIYLPDPTHPSADINLLLTEICFIIDALCYLFV